MMKFNLNLMKDPDDKRDFPFLSSLTPDELKSGRLTSIPEIVDHSDLMSPVKNQGQLGSCVGFAVTALKEWQEQKEHKEEVEAGKFDHREDEEYYDLSEAWVYWMSKKIDAWPNLEGTSIRYAMKVLNTIGVPSEKAWPYDDKVKGEPKAWAKLVARWSLISTYYRVNTLSELLMALVEHPVAIGIACFEGIFFVDETGIVPMPSSSAYCYGGHAVCAVGYDQQRKLIKFKNSWGADWGDSGYGYLHYDYVGANNYMWDAWHCRDLSVTNEMLKGASKLL